MTLLSAEVIHGKRYLIGAPFKVLGIVVTCLAGAL